MYYIILTRSFFSLPPLHYQFKGIIFKTNAFNEAHALMALERNVSGDHMFYRVERF